MIQKGFIAAAGMFWSILWALILGFFLSGLIMAFVSKRKMVQLLGKPGPKELALALFFGTISSSCSYAASSMTKSLFQKGAHIIPALAFLLASTNLVIELSLVLWVLMGWPFVAAEFAGGVILVLIMSLLMHWFAPLEEFRKKQEELAAAAETGSAAEDVSDPKTLAGWKRAAQLSLHEWRMIGKDIVLGVVISGFLMVFVPDEVWRSLFLQGASSGFLKIVENALLGPIVSMLSFVCSVGNIPLASVLYHGGIGFGGVISFVYADLIIIPLILVYRKYFGWKLAAWITGIFYISMVLTGILVELLFGALGWIPEPSAVMAAEHANPFNSEYTLVLNIVFLFLAVILFKLSRFGGTDSGGECCH